MAQRDKRINFNISAVITIAALLCQSLPMALAGTVAGGGVRVGAKTARAAGAAKSAAGQKATSAAKTALSPAKQLKDGLSVNRPVKDKWALVVGISKFQNPSINLKYPSKDACDFYNYLINTAHFAPDHVKLLTDAKATRARILSELGDKWLPRAANPDDLVVIYFSGHGSPADIDVGGVNYLVAYDTDVDSLYATGIPIQDLVRTIKARVHSERVVIILDACHSGAASADAKGLVRTSNVSAADISEGTGQLVIASSKPDQVSWEGRGYQNSVFTRNLIEGLKSNGDKTTLGEAFEYMKDKVQEEVLRDRGVMQTPVLKSQWQGSELAMALPPSKPRLPIPEDNGVGAVTITTSGGLSGQAVPMSLSIESTPIRPASGNATTVITSASAGVVNGSPLPPKTVFNNGNIYAVDNRPTSAARFTLESPAQLIYLYTYHWNYGKGAPAGTISLKNDDGTIYGPFMATGKPGQGGVPSAYWECEPNIVVKAGNYKIIDSDPATWSQNAGSAGIGMAKVKVVPMPGSAATDAPRIKNSPVITIFNNGNVYRVFNKPTNITSVTIKVPTLITNLMNYHWNDGRGQDPGQITLMRQDGLTYGPFNTHGSLGQGGVPNAYWLCEPNVVIKPGIYAVLDSDVDTWAQNDPSGRCGICDIKGVPQQ
ncbi:MAG: caspase family protein [Candidatus Obscuribacter sp.]|nr:caspase family protein [Candidatus Obscuribacter sp.]